MRQKTRNSAGKSRFCSANRMAWPAFRLIRARHARFHVGRSRGSVQGVGWQTVRGRSSLLAWTCPVCASCLQQKPAGRCCLYQPWRGPGSGLSAVASVGWLRRRKKNFRKFFRRFTKQSLYIRVVVVVNGGPILWTKRLTLEKSSTYRTNKAVHHRRVEAARKLDKILTTPQTPRFCTKQACGYQEAYPQMGSRLPFTIW